MIYPAKKNQELRGSRSKTPLSVQDEIKDTIVQLSVLRWVKKSLKSLSRSVKKSLKSPPRGVGKAANILKPCKTTADSVPEWLAIWRRLTAEHWEKSLVTQFAVSVACHTKPHPTSFAVSLPVLNAALHSPYSLLSKLVLYKPKEIFLSDNYNDYLLQRGNGNFEDSEDSADSQSSQDTDSSQDVTEHLFPWSRMLDEAQERYEVQLNALVNECERNGDSENPVAHLKAQNSLLPLYRKELRKVLLEYLQWMRAMKKDYAFQTVMETQKRPQRYRWIWLVRIDRTSHR